MQSWTVFSQPTIQDSTKEVGVARWRLWRMVHDIQELKESRKVIKAYENKLNKADSALLAADTLINNQKAIILSQDKRDSIQTAFSHDLIKETVQLKKEFRRKIVKLVLICTLEGVVIVLLLI